MHFVTHPNGRIGLEVAGSADLMRWGRSEVFVKVILAGSVCPSLMNVTALGATLNVV